LPAPRQAVIDARQVAAVLLRIQGRLYHQIAEELGYKTIQGAQAAVEAGLRKVALESTEGARKLDVLRIEAYLQALQSQIAEGKTKAISTALAALRRRGALLALDPSINQPVAVQVNLIKIGDAPPRKPKELTDAELAAAIEYGNTKGLLIDGKRFLPDVEVGGESIVNIYPEEEVIDLDNQEEEQGE
jgi:hypothetical protein